MLIQTVALYLARFISFLAVITGPLWFVNHNLAFQIFGLPKAIAGQKMAAFGPAIGGRNMSLGTLIILASYYLTYQQTGLALALIATGSGLSDTEVCLRLGKGHKRHLGNLVFCYGVSAVLLLS
ncbi:DUF4267 domain-containing protein [Aspergillus foveolatus]|uniref:DUF4267 domain-containing protein n=1 Tax=Aspergillus foveolatus TaxID=210207 RepID=UPI003CCCF2AF